MNKKRLLTSALALGTAAALALGGTFAWQSISQEALNESADVVNPGGRLHSDLYYTSFNETDNNIYVENFTDPEKGGEDIFARVRLGEYFEVVRNYNTPATSTSSLIGSKEQKLDGAGAGMTDDDGNPIYEYTYEPIVLTKGADGHFTTNAVGEGDDAVSYWTLNTGTEKSAAVYMPTFNKNKDSVEVDVNGRYRDTLGGISKREEGQYQDYEVYAVGDKVVKSAIYDIDGNTYDELSIYSAQDIRDIIDGADNAPSLTGLARNVQLKTEEHTAKAVNATKGLISMADWQKMVDAVGTYNEEEHGGYWVYDTDGWIYWSSPIPAGETTGLLLDSFTLNEVMDDTWYYALEVDAQFITADDAGFEDGTGFFDTTAGSLPSSSARTLLMRIGVELNDSVEVTTDAALREVLAQGGVAKLAGKLKMTSTLTVNNSCGIDLNGYELSHSPGAWVDNFIIVEDGGDLVISVQDEGYSSFSAGSAKTAVLVKKGGKVTFNIDDEYTYLTAYNRMVVADGGVAVINGGIYKGRTATRNDVLTAQNGGTVYFNEGTVLLYYDTDRFTGNVTVPDGYKVMQCYNGTRLKGWWVVPNDYSGD